MVELRPFQRRFLKESTRLGIDTAALSIPRGNGKNWLAGRPRPASAESGHVHHVRTSRDPPSCGRTDWTHGSPAFGRASWPRPLGPTSMSPAGGRAQLHRAWPWPRCAVGRVDPPHAKAGGRPLRISYPAELHWRGPDTYEFRLADRTDDYSASDFVISEVLQQTDFDGIRHGVLSSWRFW